MKPNTFPLVRLATILACILVLTGGCKQGYEWGPSAVHAKEPGSSTSMPLYAFTMTDIDGHPVPLSTYEGKVLLLVNTASFCGNTPQYSGLQELYERYRNQGFEILAFPANNFGQQEPGNNTEIKSFCFTKYALEFPLFSKISVKGEDTHPLYQYLTMDTLFPGDVEWNFQKFLVNRKGEVIARYKPGMKPLTDTIVNGIEHALSEG
jgi:glutathione peroxidase